MNPVATLLNKFDDFLIQSIFFMRILSFDSFRKVATG
jgi:hypothetical protein